MTRSPSGRDNRRRAGLSMVAALAVFVAACGDDPPATLNGAEVEDQIIDALGAGVARTYAAGGADFFDGDALVRSIDSLARVGFGHRQHVGEVMARLPEAGRAGVVRAGKKHEAVAIGE